MLGMKVNEDTVVISIRSRLAKTGKSTIARIIAEALAKVGFSFGVEDTDAVPRSMSITEDLIRHTDAIGALVDRRQSVIIRVSDRPPADDEASVIASELATRDATISDMRELLEFKRAEIAKLTRELHKYKTPGFAG